jgi:ABC-type sugar transport system substrate-binding protein
MDSEGVSSALEEAQNKGFKSIYFDGKPVGMSPEQAHTAAVGPYQMGAQTRANLAKLFDRASKRGKDE